MSLFFCTAHIRYECFVGHQRYDIHYCGGIDIVLHKFVFHIISHPQLAVGTPRQKDIHVILDTGSSVFAIFAVPHGGPSWLVICLLVAACLLGMTSVGLLALSWYQVCSSIWFMNALCEFSRMHVSSCFMSAFCDCDHSQLELGILFFL